MRLSHSVSHKASRPTILIAAVGALLVVLALITVALVAPRGVPGLKYYKLDAQFDDASQIADLSEVRMAGRHVGIVTSSELRDGKAIVKLQFFPGEKKVRADATARIRLKGLLGAKFVDVDPGSKGRVLASGSVLPIKQTSSAEELLDVLQAFDAKTRVSLQKSVRGLGEGFLGRGQDFNDYLRAGPRFYGGLHTLSEAILARQGAAARFAPSAETLAGSYDPVREELANGFAPQAKVLEAFTAERVALDRALVEAPPAVDALRRGLTAATPLLDETAGLARATTTITKTAPAALRETTKLLDATAPALRASTPLLDRLATAVNPTIDFLDRVAPVISPTIKVLLNNLPPLRELGGRGCDVLDFAKNWRSTLGFGVATGTDPLSTLDGPQGSLGNSINSLRVVPARVVQPDVLLADNPPKEGHQLGRNAYPAPCAAVSERLK
jgi:virulence factor Mce-like protein